MNAKYEHTKIEMKWQEEWKKKGLYIADIKNAKETFFNLWMFPYPSAEGLHAGHAFASTGSDIFGRFMRMHGKNVFQPIGYDSFGIHAENYAIKINENPQGVVIRTTKHYEEQLRSLGHGYDWTRTVTTSDPGYYKWTQWLFVKMFEAGLAYKKKATVNFCPSCKTVLADEQVMTPKQAGKEARNALGEVVASSEDLKVCERCGTIVEKKDLDQWFFKITDYADRLLAGLENIEWSDRVVRAQRNWIGKKEGVLIHHKVDETDLKLTAFSAYPAWLFADTFLVVAPEHPIVSDLVKDTKYEKDVVRFIEDFKKNKGRGSKIDEKEGIFTGRFVIDPFSGNKMPVWLANFALMDFGTGIIRCSAHDGRDYEFASKYKIPLKEVVERNDPDTPINAHDNEGELKDSGPFSGKAISPELIVKMVDWIVEKNIGERNVNYHLRDWLVSRQRYWGAPIPMVECLDDGWVAVPEDELPVLLPTISDYKPEGTGRGPLANHKEFYETVCPKCGEKARRETDVMDTFVDSSWYFLRYPSVGEDLTAFDPDITKKWLPVNLYFGGAEHSVLHLMYARFITMVLHDLGYLTFDEPFTKFFAHGLMIKDGAKMSKSRGNVVNPDEYVAKYGADVLRLYQMFIGPMDGYPDFRDTGIEGMERFVGRVWRLFTQPTANSQQSTVNSSVATKLHQTIRDVTEEIEHFRYNTAIAKIMELVNVMTSNESRITNNELGILAKLLAPFAPHLAEEVWVNILSQPFSIHTSPWPSYEAKLIEAQNVPVVIQINGKVRATLNLPAEVSKVEVKVVNAAEEDPNIMKWLEGKTIIKKIFIPGKLINFVL